MIFAQLIRALRHVKESRDTTSLEGVPKVFWEPQSWGDDFLLELTRYHWTAVTFMPASGMTEDIALEAVSQSKEALSYIPHELKTDEVCLRATAADIGALEYVPQAMVQLCLERWLRDPSPEDWREFPARFRTPELAAQAIKRNPHVIEEIPVDEHTQEMCDAFLEGGDYDRHLEDIAMSARSKILCITCLRVNRGPIEVVPANLLHNPEIQEANQLGSLLEEE